MTNIFGDVQVLGDHELGFFTRDEGIISYWSHNTASNVSKKLAEWDVSQEFTPLHVLPLDEQLTSFFVVALEVGPLIKGDPTIKAFRLQRDSDKFHQPAGHVKLGDSSSFGWERWDRLLTPVMTDSMILFPTFHHASRTLPGSDFGFFGYDLKAERWVSIIATQITNLPAILKGSPRQIDQFQFVKDAEGKLHLLVSTMHGPTYEIPITIQQRENRELQRGT